MNIKKIIAGAASFLLLGTITDSNSYTSHDDYTFTAAATDIVAAGTHGENISWSLDSDGTLTLIGEGEIQKCFWRSAAYTDEYCRINWEEGGAPPWYDIRDNIKRIVVSENITYIGNLVFADCNNVTEITLPESLTTIDYSAFTHCDSLTSIRLPENLKEVKKSVFYYCASLTEITFPRSVEVIGECALGDNAALKSVTIENPDCVIYDSPDTICNYSNITTSGVDGIYDGVIYGLSGSTAQPYADKYGYEFSPLDLGDVNSDGFINPTDATLVLQHFSNASMNGSSTLDDAQKSTADVNGDKDIDPVDATLILSYYSYSSMGGTDSIADFISKK